MLSPLPSARTIQDRNAAQEFLDLLEPGGEFLFALKPEPQGSPWPKGCPAHVYGKLDAVWPLVERFNDEVHRVAVFIVINRHPLVLDDRGKPQRRGQHVSAVRALFADADDAAQIATVEAILGGGPPPNAVVTTGRGRHYYYLASGVAVDRFKLLQGAMATRLGTDRAVCDLGRIMRLPGTLHLKGNPYPVTLQIHHRNSITADTLVAALSLQVGPSRPPQQRPQVASPTLTGLASPSQRMAAAVASGRASALAAGIVEAHIADARSAGLALAKGQRLADRDSWRDLILFPFTTLAHEHPEFEGAIKDAFDAVTAASMGMGANVADNDAQWEAQMTTAPRGGGRTLASTFAAAANLGAAPALGTQGNPALPGALSANSGSMPLSSVSTPPNSIAQAFGALAVPPPMPQTLNLLSVPPHRQIVYGNRLARGEVSILAAPGGRGKSSIAVAWACSLASGRSLLGEWVYGPPKRVLYISTEDDGTELDRRFYAASVAHSLTPADLANVHVLGVDTVRLTLTVGSDKAATVNPQGLAALREYAQATRADVVILDPLGPLIPVGLNDNGLIASLMAQLKALTVQCDFALLILHHFKKGGDGSAEAVGGASAIVNHARAVFTVEHMAAREALAFNIMPSEQWRHFRLTDLKLNFSPPASEADWLYLASVTLPNAEPPTYPYGESVQAVTRFIPPPVTAAGNGRLDATEAAKIEAEFINKVRAAQDADRALYVAKQGARASGIATATDVLTDVIRSVTSRPTRDCEHIAGVMLPDMLARGIVAEANVRTPQRRIRRGLVVGSSPSEAP